MLKHGPKSAGEIAQAVELTPATVSYHLSQLVWFQSLGGGNENEKK